jgi:hypothetical protein
MIPAPPIHLPKASFPLRAFWAFLNIGLWGLGYKYSVRVRNYLQMRNPEEVNVWRDDQQKEWDRMNVTVSINSILIPPFYLILECSL